MGDAIPNGNGFDNVPYLGDFGGVVGAGEVFSGGGGAWGVGAVVDVGEGDLCAV